MTLPLPRAKRLIITITLGERVCDINGAEGYNYTIVTGTTTTHGWQRGNKTTVQKYLKSVAPKIAARYNDGSTLSTSARTSIARGARAIRQNISKK